MATVRIRWMALAPVAVGVVLALTVPSQASARGLSRTAIATVNVGAVPVAVGTWGPTKWSLSAVETSAEGVCADLTLRPKDRPAAVARRCGVVRAGVLLGDGQSARHQFLFYETVFEGSRTATVLFGLTTAKVDELRLVTNGGSTYEFESIGIASSLLPGGVKFFVGRIPPERYARSIAATSTDGSVLEYRPVVKPPLLPKHPRAHTFGGAVVYG